MRYFTKEWLTSAVSEEEWETAWPAYLEHLRLIDASLSPGVRELADGRGFCGFHDAVLMRADLGPDITLHFCTGDLQHGYWNVAAEFAGAELMVSPRRLRRMLRAGNIELLSDEVSVEGEKFGWTVIFSDYTVMRLTFKDVLLTASPRADRYWLPVRWLAVRRVGWFVKHYWRRMRYLVSPR